MKSSRYHLSCILHHGKENRKLTKNRTRQSQPNSNHEIQTLYLIKDYEEKCTNTKLCRGKNTKLCRGKKLTCAMIPLMTRWKVDPL
jgi:hypothetical protein